MTIGTKRTIQAITALAVAYLIIGVIIITIGSTIFSFVFGDPRERYFENKKPFVDKPTIGQMLKGAKVTEESAKSITGYTETVIQYNYKFKNANNKDVLLTVTLFYNLGNDSDSYDKITYEVGSQKISAIDFFSIVYNTSSKPGTFGNIEALSIIENRQLDDLDFTVIQKQSVGYIY